ncbi:MAG: acyl dehydratase, partial [Gammaproteobacteria bacterium]|nr:acyl dehydratase [Gammaproteobacteria bacterium]
IAHGPLVYAVMGGLQYASGINDGTLLALLSIDGWKMLGPVKHGDTLHMRQIVKDKKPTSKPEKGVVTFDREVINPRGENVQEMEATIMYRCREVA